MRLRDQRPAVTRIIPFAIVILGALACGSESEPPAKSNNPAGSIAGSSGFGGVSNSSGGASGNGGSSGNNDGSPRPTDLVDTTEESMTFQGTTRDYLLSKPKNYDANKKYPLVIAFHGDELTPQQMRESLPIDFASGDSAFVAYPKAGNGSEWNYALPVAQNGDFAFVKGLVDEIAKSANIDTNRVLGFGYSGGAYFLSQYACRVGGVLRMVAMVAGGAPEQHDGDQTRPPRNECVVCPAGPIPMYIAHGQNDESFDGGDFARICWSEQNGCSNSSLTTIDKNCKRYKNCQDGKGVIWCPVPDQDHGPWQGSLKGAWSMFNAL